MGCTVQARSNIKQELYLSGTKVPRDSGALRSVRWIISGLKTKQGVSMCMCFFLFFSLIVDGEMVPQQANVAMAKFAGLL